VTAESPPVAAADPEVVDHPLAMLTAAEVTAARAVLADAGELPDGALVAHVVVDEPTKDVLAAWSPGDPVPRRVRVLVVPGPELTMVELLVDLAASPPAIVERRVVEGMRPALSMHESIMAIFACHGCEEYVAALALRGIDDLDRVQIDPWPAGSFGYAAEEGRRIARCISFLRDDPTDNGYARPVEGLIVHVDLGRGEVIEVIDHGVVPMPTTSARYDVDAVGPLRTDLRPISIAQPEGPSFTVTGNLVEWQKWSVRVAFDPYEGLVLHQLGYRDDATGRVRPIAHRLSISEMVVPYGHPSELHGWKNAFDAGEWGLGRMTQSLTLGCDCLGEIHYFDATMANEQGEPWVVGNAICMHEEDYGIGWKHVDLFSGTHEVRRSRRLVISSIATVGNYEYGFFWYLYLDGTVQFEVKLTGIMSPMAFDPAGPDPEYATVIAPGLAAPVHQHMFCARLDLDVDGPTNVVEEVAVERVPTGDGNPWGNAFRQVATRLERESQAKRVVDAASSRAWKVSNPDVRNGLGRPVAYKLNPHMATPTLLAQPESSVAQRAGFARHNLWATPYAPDERRAAGEFPNQHAGGDGLPAWTAADRSLTGPDGAGADVVLWYSFGVTHVPRPEDWPVMPVEYAGFLLQPIGFFDRNPALDVPPSPPGPCHDGEACH
jgi:primary-amine oxidase